MEWSCYQGMILAVIYFILFMGSIINCFFLFMQILTQFLKVWFMYLTLDIKYDMY